MGGSYGHTALSLTKQIMAVSDALPVIVWPVTLTNSGGVQVCATAEALGDALVMGYQTQRRLVRLTDAAGQTLPAETLLRAALIDFYGEEKFIAIWR